MLFFRQEPAGQPIKQPQQNQSEFNDSAPGRSLWIGRNDISLQDGKKGYILDRIEHDCRKRAPAQDFSQGEPCVPAPVYRKRMPRLNAVAYTGIKRKSKPRPNALFRRAPASQEPSSPRPFPPNRPTQTRQFPQGQRESVKAGPKAGKR
jgi:hypothetical protein